MIRRWLLAALLALSAWPAFAQAPPAVPALPDSERRTSYSLSASTCPACSVGFALYGDSTDYGAWIEVWIVTGSGTSTVATQLTAVTDYTLSSATGSLATIPRPITDATITLSTARTGTLQIVGARRPRRTTQFAENRGVAARDLNQALTEIIASQRETWDRTKDVAARALLTAPGDTVGLLPNTAVRAGGILAFDGSGNPTIVAPGSSGTANVVGPNVSAVGHIATFGNTTGTLLLDGGLIGAGDFVGAASSTVNHAVTFAGATGKIGKDSGLTLTPSTGTITLTNAKTLTVSNSLTLAGTDGTVMTFPTTSATLARTDAANTFTGHQTIEGVTTTGATGTGNLVFDTAPVLGLITVTAVNGLLITPTTATLSVDGGKTARFSSSLTLAGTDGKTLTVSNSGTLAGGDAFTLAIAAGKTLTANSSLTLAGVDAKTLTVNNSGTIAGGDAFTLAIAAGKTLTASNTLTFTGTDGTSFAFPATSDTVTGIAATQTLTNKTLTAPTINGGTAQALTNLGIRSSGGGAFDMVIANSETLTAQRALTVTLNNAARLLSLSGDLTTSAAFTTAGGNALTLTTTGSTNVTLPISGTLATINTAQTFSGANVFSATQQFTDIKFSSGKIYPTSDGTTALQITKADASTRIVNVDTTNARIGINKTAGAFDLDVNGAANIGGALTFGTATITGLTINNSPSATNDYLLYYNAAAGAIRSCTVGSCAAAATAGVSSLNGLTGGLSIVAGTNISVSAAGSSVTVNNTGVTTIASNTGAFTLTNGITNATNAIKLDLTYSAAWTAAQSIASSSATAFAVGLNGTTNPAFNIDAATASSATGINIKSAAAAGGVAVKVLSSGTDENLTLDAKGAGTLTLNGTATGQIITPRTVRLSATSDALFINQTVAVAGGIVHLTWAGNAVRGIVSNDSTATAGANHFAIYSNGTISGSITSNGATAAFNTSSDGRLKSERAPIPDPRATIMSLAPTEFRWNHVAGSPRGVGFIAQEVKAALPLLDVQTGDDNPNARPSDPDFRQWGLDYGRFTPYLWAGLRDAYARIDALEQRIFALEKR